MKSPLQRRDGPDRSGNGSPKPNNGRPGGHPAGVLQGLMLVARGRSEGLACFGATPDAFLSALAPWLAFQLVYLLLMMLRAPSAVGGTLVLLAFCTLLLPPVVSHALAGSWKRGDAWIRYATAAVWCGWLVVAVAFVAALLLQFGLPDSIANAAFLGLVSCYGLWLQWFLAWRGLEVSGMRAALLVGAILVGTGALCAIAQFVPPHVGLFEVPQTDAAPNTVSPGVISPGHPNGSSG